MGRKLAPAALQASSLPSEGAAVSGSSFATEQGPQSAKVTPNTSWETFTDTLQEEVL